MGEMYPPTTADYAMAGVEDLRRNIEERFGDSPAQVSPYGVPMAPEFSKEQRRERIATAVMAQLLQDDSHNSVSAARTAVAWADALMAELDK